MKLAPFLLYAVVSISGASVLAIEILGTRVLGPFYGVSLFLWSALITVTLAALSVGYAIGGRWADRGPRPERLALLLGGAGVWLLLVPWIKRPALDLLEPLGLRAAVLVASTVLFFLPLTLLGMVSPYAIRLRASRLEHVGRTAGNIYAVSTLASVAAALLTGFVLVPSVGVNRLLLGIGVALLAGAGVVFFTARRPRATAGVSALIALAVGAAVTGALPVEKAEPGRGLLDIRQSPYAELRVVETEEQRMLFIDGGLHTVVQPHIWRSLYEYVAVMDIPRFLFRRPGNALLLGLGGGSLAKIYNEGGWSVDVVELDTQVVTAARTFFGLRDDEARIIVTDAREYLRREGPRYDLILLDAFGSSSIPFHLVTREHFGLIKERLAPDGVLALNVEAVGWTDILVRALARTLQEHFREVVALPIAEPPDQLGNVILLASDRPLEFNDEMLGHPKDFLDDEYLHWRVIAQNHAWDNRFVPDIKGAPLLTDDRNPVDLWSEAINFEGRKQLHHESAWKKLAY